MKEKSVYCCNIKFNWSVKTTFNVLWFYMEHAKCESWLVVLTLGALLYLIIAGPVFRPFTTRRKKTWIKFTQLKFFCYEANAQIILNA